MVCARHHVVHVEPAGYLRHQSLEASLRVQMNDSLNLSHPTRLWIFHSLLGVSVRIRHMERMEQLSVK